MQRDITYHYKGYSYVSLCPYAHAYPYAYAAYA